MPPLPNLRNVPQTQAARFHQSLHTYLQRQVRGSFLAEDKNAIIAACYAASSADEPSFVSQALAYRKRETQAKLHLAMDLKRLGFQPGAKSSEMITAILAGTYEDEKVLLALSKATVTLISNYHMQGGRLRQQASTIITGVMGESSSRYANSLVTALIAPDMAISKAKVSAVASSTAAAAPQVLFNYMGNGNPKLTLTLSANGAGWGGYSIPYQSSGNVPYSSDSSKQWSAWDIYDDNGNYYGTINLNSNGSTVTPGQPSYVPPNPDYGYSVAGFGLTSTPNGYMAAVSAVYQPAVQQLQIINDLNNGQALYLDLSNNQANWDTYELNPGSTGNIPQGWSSWPIHDGSNQTGNYYGTISLYSDSLTVTFGNPAYAPSNTGFGIDPTTLSITAGPNSTFKVNGSPVNVLLPGPFPDAPPAKPATLSGTNTPIVISAQNGQITAGGKSITLLGQNVESMEWSAQGADFISPDFITYISQFWDGNHIRIPLNQDFWLNSEDKSTIGSYKQIVDAMIQCATANGMAVILDLHWLDSTVQQAPMANELSVDFWTDIAKTYGYNKTTGQGFGTVMFELYNEPYGITPDEWQASYQQLIYAVRAAGADNLLMVAGLDYGYDLSFVDQENGLYTFDDPSYPGDPNITYVCHPYVTQGVAYNQGKGMPGYPVSSGGDFATCLSGITQSPVIFTEFGNSNSQDYPQNASDPNTQYQYAVGYYLDNQNVGRAVHRTGFAIMPDAYDVTNKPNYPEEVDTQYQPYLSGVQIYQFVKSNPSDRFIPITNTDYAAPVKTSGSGLFGGGPHGEVSRGKENAAEQSFERPPSP